MRAFESPRRPMPNTYRRRKALGLILKGAGVTLLAACAPAQTTPTPVSPAATPPPQTPALQVTAATSVTPPSLAAAATNVGRQPKAGGTLRLGVPSDIGSLDGYLATVISFDTTWLVWDRLTAYDLNLKPQPMLAESWDVSGDDKSVKLNLRRGVQFHNGRELTSDDVKYNLVRIQDPKVSGGQFAEQGKWFTTIDTPDKYSIVLGSETPRPSVFDFFEYFNILDKDSTEGPNARTSAVGTGPFSFVEWAQGDHIAFAKNQNYWQTGRPYFDGVRALVFHDQTSMVSQLEAGALDIAKSPTYQDFVRLKANPAYAGVMHPADGTVFLTGVNVLNSPIDNKKVRQALNYAFDRKRFVDSVLLGVGQPESLPWLTSSIAYDPAKQNFYTFDLDKAKSLLSDAGVSEFEMDFIMRTSNESSALAEMYQADLAKIGVKLNIKVLEPAAWLDLVNNHNYNGMYIAAGTYSQLNPSYFFSGRAGGARADNNSGFKDDAYNALVASASAEPDLDKQKQLWAQVNDMFLDESFSMVLSPQPPILLTRAAVQDIGFTLHTAFSFTDAWIER